MARDSGPERWSTGISLGRGSKPMEAVGGLFAMAKDAGRNVFRRPFQWREFLEQSWFVVKVSLVPTVLVAIPFTVLVSFTLNILLRELGAADLSGAGAAFGAVTQVGPLVTVLIVAGAGATAMCADLGSRTIREEIAAMEVLGIDPVQRLVTPRMLAAGLVALLLNSLVVIIGILGGYFFSVFIQDVNPGAFAAGITLLTWVPEVIISCVKVRRPDRRAGGLLPGPDYLRWWREGGGQRRERNRGGVRLHGAVRDQRGRHGHWHPDECEVAGASDGHNDDSEVDVSASARQFKRPTDILGRIGDHMLFYVRALGGVPHAAIHFRKEIIRLIAEISMGAGTLAMIGGTVVIVGFLTLAAGGTLAVQGYSSLGNIGIEALTGFLAAFINVRISAPVVAGIGLAATFGAGVTAQLGAMRINEEIDALVAMAIRPVEYLVSTRLVAGMIAITPLYSIAVVLSFLASQFTTVVLFGQSGGLYNHYFNTFLNPIDLLWSFLQAVLMAILILLIHTYYGYFASGGPSGVGVAVGNAVRTSLIVVVSVTLLVSLSIYGSNGNFNLSG